MNTTTNFYLLITITLISTENVTNLNVLMILRPKQQLAICYDF
jgi:hypothetical protein